MSWITWIILLLFIVGIIINITERIRQKRMFAEEGFNKKDHYIKMGKYLHGLPEVNKSFDDCVALYDTEKHELSFWKTDLGVLQYSVDGILMNDIKNIRLTEHKGSHRLHISWDCHGYDTESVFEFNWLNNASTARNKILKLCR